MEWADETIVRLRELWSEGHSTAEIGRRLGVSKNAVVGKAHRLDLPARPSPIRREGERPPSRPGPPRRYTGPSLPPLSSTAVSSMALGSAGLAPALPAAQLPPRPPVVIAPRSAPLPRVAQPAGLAATAAVRARHHLLLADRRARHAQLPLLRWRVGAGQAVLPRARAAGLREGAGSREDAA